MREMKFRAYDKQTGEMYYPGDRPFMLSPWGVPVYNETRLESFIVLQFTGLRDKNGKGIYEGDIWLVQGGDIPMVIVWHRYGWWFQYPNGGVTRPMEWTEDGEVIGNIYEHPHLLGDST